MLKQVQHDNKKFRHSELVSESHLIKANEYKILKTNSTSQQKILSF